MKKSEISKKTLKKLVSTNYKIVPCKSKEEWLATRGLGGSDVAAILGLSKWKSKLDVWLELTGKKKADNVENEFTLKGTKYEPLIRDLFSLEHDKYEVINPPKDNWVFINQKEPLLTASLDGVLINKETKERGVIEIKTHKIQSKADAEEWANGLLPQQYYIQVLYYLLITGYKFAHLYAYLDYYKYNDNDEYVKDKVEFRDFFFDRSELESDINFIEKQVKDFIKLVENNQIPPSYI